MNTYLWIAGWGLTLFLYHSWKPTNPLQWWVPIAFLFTWPLAVVLFLYGRPAEARIARQWQANLDKMQIAVDQSNQSNTKQ